MRRRAFTLIELLVTITIIAIMATLFLGGMYSSIESSKVAKTRSTIAKLNNVIMRKWEAYRTRRVPITIVSTQVVNFNGSPTMVTPIISAGWRLDALRELMRMEMPDRWTDVIVASSGQPAYPANYTTASGAGTVPTSNRPGLVPPSLFQAYVRKFNAITTSNAALGFQAPNYKGSNVVNQVSAGSSSNSPSISYQGAECLYMIVTTGMSDEMDDNALFRQAEVGDYDGDGAQEFIDAWGTPISFLRWAPGFVSELQTHNDPDPFDPMHVYPNSNYASTMHQAQVTYALYPLIFSAGPDKAQGIVSRATDQAAGNAGGAGASDFAYSNYNNNPFIALNDTTICPNPFQIGTRLDLDGTYGTTQPNSTTMESTDDIHNHLLGTR